ncbi:hypothetical protein CAL26_10030 [Bordetella genomosp. 9]|uniref:Uncharacterized protein n=1 Tax=Bordetella genomosp. 9 TaxID=1416803 RepID=A0A261RFF7_9BORD|nr:hypothetical protein [Bordetella genomosp. 9]OZI23759.1 hypothetical protein CAL26_10030 [Bordetella genomosp. 9]
MDFDWKKIIGTAAPMLATALGGPLAGIAVSTIGNAMGLGDQPTDDAIAAAIAGKDPDAILKLKQAENDFSAKMAELGFKNEADLAKIAADDRASARQREVETHDWTPRALAFVVTFGFFSVLAAMIWAPLPDGVKEPLLILLGSLGTAWTTIMAYYFGSTAGGQKKSDLLAKATIPPGK